MTAGPVFILRVQPEFGFSTLAPIATRSCPFIWDGDRRMALPTQGLCTMATTAVAALFMVVLPSMASMALK